MIPVVDLGEIDSTSREAARRAASGDLGPVWLRATAQSAGRGRSGRDWTSPPGNLYATLLMPVTSGAVDAALRSFVACLAVARTVDELVADASRVALKWPNDVQLDQRKVAGVLLESGENAGRRWLSVGIGLNLAHVPPAPLRPATSIAAATGAAPPSPERAMAILSDAFADEEDIYREQGFAATRRRWLARAARIGKEIEVRLPHETFSGRFDGLGEDGTLLVLVGEQMRRIAAADVYFPGE